MDHQGGRRSRPAADARQAPWPPAEDPSSAPASPTSSLPASPPSSSPSSSSSSPPGQLIGPGTGGYGVLQTGRAPVPPRVLGPGSGPQPTLNRTSGTGAQPTLNRTSGTGAQPAFGTGGQPTLDRIPGTGAQPAFGTGAQPTLDRTAARGFPPAGPGYQQPATPPQGLPVARDDDPVPPATIAPRPGGRRAARAAGSSGSSGPSGSSGSSGSRRRSARVAWLSLGIVLVIVAGALAGYKFLYEPRVNAPVSASLRLPTDGPSSPGFDPALGKWQHIGARSQDPAPLTLAVLFPPQFELDGSSYVRTAAALSKDCTQAVFGANLQAALQAGHCTQVLRASYLSGDGTMMGTVGVANLIGSNAAQKAGQTTGPQEIIAPLAAQKGPTSKLGNGTGVVQAEIKGHYLILMWAEFTSLKSPTTAAQRQQLEQFAANLVIGSANINLSTRMLTGKQ
jgi:hypothetical protein